MTLRFTLKQLEHFTAIVEAGSFRKAAELAFTAQPALSMSIRKLEDGLNLKLFHRTAPVLELTNAGRVFYEKAKRILLQSQRAVESAQSAAEGIIGRVQVGFLGSAAYRILPSTIPSILDTLPGLQLILREGTSVGICEQLKRGQLDVGILRRPAADTRGLVLKDVDIDHLIAVVPRTHPLAQLAEISLSDLSREPFVMFSETEVYYLRQKINRICLDAGFAPAVSQEAVQAVTVIGLVGSGLGVAIVPAVTSTLSSRSVRFLTIRDVGAHNALRTCVAITAEGASEAAQKVFEQFNMA